MPQDPQSAHESNGAPSLVAMCQRKASRLWKTITDVGLLPYPLVVPVLRKIENPDHLRSIEVQSPHIAEDSGPLWEALIRRDIANFQSKLKPPKDPRNWWKVYNKLKAEQEKDIEREKAQLKARLQGIKAEKEKMTSNVSDNINPRFLVERPRGSFGGWGDKPAKDSTYFNVGPGGKRTLSGKGFISHIQSKARDHAKLKTPTHVRAGRVAAAPRSMMLNNTRPRPMPVDNGRVAVPKSMMRPEHVQAARAQNAAPATTSTRPASTPSLAQREQEIARKERELKAREERLKTMARGTASGATSSAAGTKRQAPPADADNGAVKRRREANSVYSMRR